MKPTQVTAAPELVHWKGSRRLDRMVARFAGLLVATLTVVFTSYYGLEFLNNQDERVDAMQLDTRRALRSQIDEESGIRGFIATGNRLFLQPYYSGRETLRTLEPKMLRETPAEWPEARALVHFIALSRAWEATIARPVLTSRVNPRSTSLRALTSFQLTGKSLVDSMRLEIASMDTSYTLRRARLTGQARYLEEASAAVVFLLITGTALLAYLSERRSAMKEQALLISVMQTRDSAARLSEWRSKIVAMLAHDFKSQLATVRGYAELLEDFPERRSEARAYDAIRTAVSRLSTMADEALLMARVANDQLQVRHVPLSIRDVLGEAVLHHAVERDIRIIGPDALALGDRDYLVRVFDNLITNAIKYSRPPSPIEIHVNPRERRVLEVAVKDFGHGIDADELPHVFEEYWRSPNAQRAVGSGIGLFIVKKIVDAHGGEITIQSERNVGTTIVVQLPMARDRRARPRVPSENRVASPAY